MIATQSLSKSSIRNHTDFGKRLQRFARIEQSRLVAEHGFGFQDGGCGILAQAIVDWSGGALAFGAFYRSEACDNVIQHLVAHLDGLCLDSDGLATSAEVSSKLAHFEHPGFYVFSNIGQSLPPNAIPVDGRASRLIEVRASKSFGPFSSSLLLRTPDLPANAERIPAARR
jgi:hypothetical protein